MAAMTKRLTLICLMTSFPLATVALAEVPKATFTLHQKGAGAAEGAEPSGPSKPPSVFGNFAGQEAASQTAEEPAAEEPATDEPATEEAATEEDGNLVVPDYSDGDEALDRALDAYLSIFYHEFGHALIDLMQLPVLGLEEDAADTLSVVMIEDLWEADSSAEKLRAAAGFWDKSARAWEETGEAPDFGGVHSPDRRRYFTYVCLYFGADPDNRLEMAQDLGLPEDRAESCPDEFALANKSWMPFLEQLRDAGAGETLVWTEAEAEDSPFAAMLRDEVQYLNETLSLPEPLAVTFTSCGMENAFYSPGDKSITMCTELADYMYAAEQAAE